MKRNVKLAMVVVVMFFVLGVHAQKFGHVDANKLVNIMPEKEKATKELQDYSKQLEDELIKMQDELKKKYDDYQSKQEGMNEIIKQTKEKELQELNQRIQSYQQKAQQDLAKKEQDLLQPIYEKIKKTIKEVGEENKLTYIFDTSVLLFYSGDSKDVFNLVKSKLGVKN